MRSAPTNMPVVIFVTAFDNHALKAFEAHAFDYLLKPIDDERFATTVERARQRVVEREESEVARRLAALMQRHPPSTRARRSGPSPAPGCEQRCTDQRRKSDRRPRPRSSAAHRRRRHRLDWRRWRLRAHSRRRQEPSHSRHDDGDGATPRPERVRPHPSLAIVNASRIRELRPYSSREYAVILRDGTRLRLSRRYRERLRAHFGEYL